jgi:hypothetical protein
LTFQGLTGSTGTSVRVVMLISALGALGTLTMRAGQAWPKIMWLVPVVMVLATVGARAYRAVTVSLMTALAPCYTGLLILTVPYLGPTAPALWGAAALGVALAGGPRWSMPPFWRSTLALWGAVIAVTWPVVALRELDFTPSLITNFKLGVTGEGINAPEQFTFVASVAFVLLIGILWTDALWRLYAVNRDRIVREVIAPFAIGILASVAVGFYQGFIDISFLNTGSYTYLRRASGLMFDANAFGTLAALGGAAWFAIASAARPLVPAARAGAAVAGILCWAGVWLSGSRTALLCVVVTAALAIVIAFRRRPQKRAVLLAGAALIAIASIAVMLRARADVTSPVSRIWSFVATSGGGRPAAVLRDLWERDRYGSAAVEMVREHPISGIGVGVFHSLVVDWMYAGQYPRIPPDNAQNWWRHQLVEFGLLGSIGWILFTWYILRLLWRLQRYPPADAGTAISAATLAGLGAVSLVGMPTQSLPVLATAAALFVWSRISTADPGMATLDAKHLPTWAVWALVMAALGACVYASVTELRVPLRAARHGWTYHYGFQGLDGSTFPAFQWTERRAVAVLKPTGKYLRLRFRVQHPDVAERPVDVRVKLFGNTVIRERLRTEDAMVRYIEVPTATRYIMLTFLVSRTFQAPGPDPRELGLAVDDWIFVDTPPEGAWVVR